MFLKSVTESNFRKSSGLFIAVKESVTVTVTVPLPSPSLLLIKLQAFTVYDNERVNGGVCF